MTVEVGAGDAELLAHDLWERGAVGVEEMPGRLRAAFTDEGSAERARRAMNVESSLEEVDDAFGLDAAHDLLRVETAGRFAVHPPWLTPPDGLLAIEIAPGRAFGSGSHPSTRLMLELVADEVPPAQRVFDIGCGSGVVAIGAARLGADVIAVDLDPAAVEATTANAERNGVAHRVRATTGSADHLSEGADLVTVNVTVDIHEALATRLHRSHRRLAVAGVLGRTQLDRCARAYGATIERLLECDGWMAAVLTRP